MTTAYFMAPVRGKDGDNVERAVKWDNIGKALEVAEWLMRKFPTIKWYIPHRNEIFVEALIDVGVTSEQIVSAFSAIAATKDIGVSYDNDGISSGMCAEAENMRLAGKPVAHISTTNENCREQIACAIALSQATHAPDVE